MSANRNSAAWCITDGSAGMISQAKGLAAAMQLDYTLKEVDLNFPWRHLPAGGLPIIPATFKNYRDFLPESCPKFVISSSRKSVYMSLFLKKMLKEKVKTIHIQDPRVNTRYFDYIIAPEHDGLDGDNVFTTTLAVNHIDDTLIKHESAKFSVEFSSLSRPIITVLVGGKSRNYIFDNAVLDNFIDALEGLVHTYRASLIILFSRRTDPFIRSRLREKFRRDQHVWDDPERNPYIALLGLSSYIICTSDSVSMISEAITANASVYIFRLKNRKKNNRVEQFNNKVLALGWARAFTMNLTPFNITTDNETKKIAYKIINHMRD